MNLSGIPIDPSCCEVFNDFKKGGSPIKYIIYKISEDGTKVVVDEIGREQDYDVFREKLIAAKDSKGNPRPSYAVYNMEFTLKEGGARSELAYITYIDDSLPARPKMIYAATGQGLATSLNAKLIPWQANDTGDLEWKGLLKEASRRQETI